MQREGHTQTPLFSALSLGRGASCRCRERAGATIPRGGERPLAPRPTTVQWCSVQFLRGGGREGGACMRVRVLYARACVPLPAAKSSACGGTRAYERALKCGSRVGSAGTDGGEGRGGKGVLNAKREGERERGRGGRCLYPSICKTKFYHDASLSLSLSVSLFLFLESVNARESNVPANPSNGEFNPSQRADALSKQERSRSIASILRSLFRDREKRESRYGGLPSRVETALCVRRERDRKSDDWKSCVHS